MRSRIGTSGFAYKEWKGSFYPDDLAQKAMLRYYASKFRCVEINNTFYRMPTASVVVGWADEVPDDFAFVLKAPQRITHMQRLKGSEDTVAHFLRVAAELGNKQGPLLFQLPPNFKKDTARLVEFLAHIPPAVKAAFEFRHESWFADDVYDALRARGVALCIAENENGATPLVSTASWGYLRLREVEYTEEALRAWAAKIRATSWDDAWIFFKHEDTGTGPRLAAELVRIMSEPGATNAV